MVRGRVCLAVVVAVLSLAGCATPAAPDPRGKWLPVNRMADAPQAIPLNQIYVFQATPVDGTLKSMLTRWARDQRMTLSYLHPNDYTLYGPVGSIRTPSLVEAATALTNAYETQNLAVVVDRSTIVVSLTTKRDDSVSLPRGVETSSAGAGQ